MRYFSIVLLLMVLMVLPGLSGCGGSAIPPSDGVSKSQTPSPSGEFIKTPPKPHDPNDI